jgi:hypothetical protein
MVRRVDAAAGVAVDIPGAAELGIFPDNRVGDAEVSQGDRERDGVNAGTGDQHMMLLVRRVAAPARLARENLISPRISGAYSGATFSPRQARIIFSISSSPGSVINGPGLP